MTYPIVFGNLAAGNQPASDFDTMFNVAGQQGNIPCTASGTNAITLTPGGNYYVPSSYTNAQIVSFKAVNNSSGSVTLQIGGLGLLKVFVPAGTQAGSGDIVNGNHYEMQYWSDLDTGTGGFLILNATVSAVSNPPQGSFKNLRIANDPGTPNSQVLITADAVILQNNSGGTVRLTSVSQTLFTGTAGLDGLDTGSLAPSTWYAVYIIYNPTSSTTGCLMSLSATAPTLPSGFSFFARFGWVRTNASNLLFLTLQKGRIANYTVGTASSTVPSYIALASGGAAGSLTVPTFVTISVTSVVPTQTASSFIGSVAQINAAVTQGTVVVPNTNFGSWLTSNYPPVSVVGTGGNSNVIQRFTLLLESTNIFYASSASNNNIVAIGWEDNL